VKKQTDPGKGYGNIYTPHAGSMIITVQREAGLANRTLVLSPRRVKALRLLNSRIGLSVLGILVLSWIVLAVQAVRVPLLQQRLANMEKDAARLDTLEQTLGELQQRYTQVQRMLGAAPAAQPALPESTGGGGAGVVPPGAAPLRTVVPVPGAAGRQ
jgi:hypothetical protein